MTGEYDTAPLLSFPEVLMLMDLDTLSVREFLAHWHLPPRVHIPRQQLETAIGVSIRVLEYWRAEGWHQDERAASLAQLLRAAPATGMPNVRYRKP